MTTRQKAARYDEAVALLRRAIGFQGVAPGPVDQYQLGWVNCLLWVLRFMEREQA